MKKLGWRSKFDQVIKASEAAGWSWKSGTCLDMMMDSAEAITGKDVRKIAEDCLGAPWRGSSKVARIRDLKKMGGPIPAIERVAEACGFPELELWQASAGDWGVAHFMGDPGRPDLAEGVVRGDGFWIYRLPDHGVTRLPDAYAEGVIARAWGVM